MRTVIYGDRRILTQFGYEPLRLYGEGAMSRMPSTGFALSGCSSPLPFCKCASIIAISVCLRRTIDPEPSYQ